MTTNKYIQITKLRYLLFFFFILQLGNLVYSNMIKGRKNNMVRGYSNDGYVIKLYKKTSYDDHIINMNFLTEIQTHLGNNYYDKFVLSKDPISGVLLQNKINKKALKFPMPTITRNNSTGNFSLTKIIPLKNFKNTQYIGIIAIGNPEQKIPVIFDTGSGNLWVTSALCSSVSCKRNKVVYNRKTSLNFNRIGLGVEVTFGTGVVSGEINEDTFKLGGINIPKQKFAEILEQRGEVFESGKFSGILGLGYPGMAAYNIKPVFDTIIADKLLKKNIMAFYFSLNEETEGEVTFGFVNPNRYEGDIDYYDVSDRYYWTIDMEDILYNGMSLGLCEKGCKAIADTGTTLLAGPTPDVKKLLKAIPTEHDCSNYDVTGTLEFVFKGKKYSLDAQEYISKTTQVVTDRNTNTNSTSITCSAMVMPLDVPRPHGPAWILGGTFLQKYYSVYDRDNNRIGFALATHESPRKDYED